MTRPRGFAYSLGVLHEDSLGHFVRTPLSPRQWACSWAWMEPITPSRSAQRQPHGLTEPLSRILLRASCAGTVAGCFIRWKICLSMAHF